MSMIIPCILIVSMALFGPTTLKAQDSLFQKMASENMQLFQQDPQGFQGEGWDHIVNNAHNSANMLVGEDHFSNEIPAFVKALATEVEFDNFYIEVDPYSTEIIEASFKDLNEEQREVFRKQYGYLYSFYALKPEYELLEYLLGSGLSLLGSDQIVMYADRLIVQDLAKKTSLPEAKEKYEYIMDQSRSHLQQFHQDPKNPMYFMTADFQQQLDTLEQWNLSELEHQIIRYMRRSVTIYREQNHRMRVQLLLHHLMQDYPHWKDAKNLFKYGANHLLRGESFLTVHDIGNVVANISKSRFESSFHLMIVGESGSVGSIFKGFPEAPVDKEKGFYQNFLTPFFELTEGDQWHLFNLLPLREAVEKGKLQIDNSNLLRTVKGYDALVIIPGVTPARFD